MHPYCGMALSSTVGPPQQGGLSKVVSRYKVAIIAWHDWNPTKRSHRLTAGWSLNTAVYRLTEGNLGHHICTDALHQLSHSRVLWARTVTFLTVIVHRQGVSPQ